MLRKLDEISAATRLVDKYEEHQKDCLEKLCARLIVHNVDEIRCRLDRKYLEAIQPSRNLKAPQSGQANELLSSIKAELETLYSEINVVALMSTDQTFKAPLAKSIEQCIVQREDQIISVFDDVRSDTLTCGSSTKYIRLKLSCLISRRRQLIPLHDF